MKHSDGAEARRSSARRGPVGTASGDPEDGTTGDGGYNAGIALLSYIIAGILVWSLIGWGLDNLLGTRWIVLVGALLGAAGGLYLSHAHNLTRVPRADPDTGQDAPEESSQEQDPKKSERSTRSLAASNHILPNDGHSREETR